MNELSNKIFIIIQSDDLENVLENLSFRNNYQKKF